MMNPHAIIGFQKKYYFVLEKKRILFSSKTKCYIYNNEIDHR